VVWQCHVFQKYLCPSLSCTGPRTCHSQSQERAQQLIEKKEKGEQNCRNSELLYIHTTRNPSIDCKDNVFLFSRRAARQAHDTNHGSSMDCITFVVLPSMLSRRNLSCWHRPCMDSLAYINLKFIDSLSLNICYL
jgi:hypothetical protein